MSLREQVEALWDESYQNGPAPTEAEVAVDAMLLRVLALIPKDAVMVTEEHEPEIGGHCDSGLYLECSCGWSDFLGGGRWRTHIEVMSS